MMTTQNHLRLLDLFKYYKKLAHQTAAIQMLEDEIDALDPYILSRDAEWYQTWVAAIAPKECDWLITREQVANVAGYAPADFDDVFMRDLNKLIRVTDMVSLNQRRHLISQTCHETGRYRWMKELSSGEQYNNRHDLGNGPNDGALYKGGGVIMLTGRANYQDFSNWMERSGMADDRIMKEGADYVADTYPFLSAVCWIEKNKWAEVCKGDDVYQVTRVLNGGYNGIDDRLHYYEKACQYIQE
jgi:putative chitinase